MSQTPTCPPLSNPPVGSRLYPSSTTLYSTSTLYTAPLALLQPVIPLRTTRYELVKLPTRAPNLDLMTFPNGTYKGKGKLNATMLGLSEIPEGWQEYVHPDGKPYFRQEKWGLVTEVNIRHSSSLLDLTNLYTIINDRWHKHPAYNDQRRYELYLAIETKKKPGNYYYFVEHDAQNIFWLEDMPAQSIIGSVGSSMMSYEVFILRNYYSHLENFPGHNDLPEDAVDFLRSALIYTCTDHMTSAESATSPWSAQESKDFLALLNELEVNKVNRSDPRKPLRHNQSHRTWFVARLNCVILKNRLAYKHGLTEARTGRLVSLKPSLPGFLDYFAGVLTLFAHMTYVQRFENVWVDNIVSFGAWQRLLNSLFTEWSDSNLMATVVLSANMAFLALPNLSMAGRTTSIISTSFSIGSIVLGLHHVWRFRDKSGTTATQAGRYFRNAARLTGNLRPLSFFVSLPFSLFFWSIVTFAASVFIYASQVVAFYFSLGVLAIMLVTVTLTVLFFWSTVFT